jgi:hypothetical protein
MWFTNLQLRLKEYPQGWVVERRKGIRWVHLIGVSGMEEKPWYYSTKEIAIEEAKKYIEWDLLANEC